jgi:hypothetical protein
VTFVGPFLMSQLSNLQFKTAVHHAFPDRSSARAARFAGVAQRTMQKWMSGESDVPQTISDAVAHQARIAEQTEVRRHLEESCQEFLDADGHPEALGSILSAVYQKIMGKPIE